MRFLLVALLLLVGATAEAASPARGPYIQRTTPTAATIVWRTSTTAATRLLFGAAPDALVESRMDSAAVVQHEVRLDQLTPNTRYYYAVDPGDGSLFGGDDDHYFVTAPDVGTTDAFTFWVVGDSGVATAKQARVRDAMLRESGDTPPDVYLHVGDMAYSDGTDDELQKRFFDMYPNILRNTVSFPAIGNHESGASDSLTTTGPYYDAYVLPTNGEAGGLASGSEAYYSWDWANVHFIVLETYREELRAQDGAMLAWLQMDLDATDQDWIVAYFHHPPYTKGSHDSDVEIAHVEVREWMMPMLEAAGVDLVLGGHSHIYERSHLIFGAHDTPTTAAGHIVDPGSGRGNTPYEKLGDGAEDGSVCIVAGHGGTNAGQDGTEDHPLMFMTELINGSVIVAVDDDVMTVKNIRLDGVVSDEFSITKGHAIRILDPRPDTTLVAGSTTSIAWVSSGRITAVDLAYSTDGENWTSIGTVDDTGQYTWTVPDVAGSRIAVRVSDAGATEAADVMDGDAPVIDTAATLLIPFKSQWRLGFESLDGQDWTAADFRDTPWTRGRGEFAICGCLPWECACNTYLAEALLTPTVYFRKKFDLGEDLEFTTLELSILHEVGAKVWINGTEVYSRHVEDESFEAMANPEARTLTIEKFVIDLETNPVLVPGQNVVAVLVKKNETLGLSLYFDLEMRAIESGGDDGCGCSSAPRAPHQGMTGLLLLLVLAFRPGRSRRASRRAQRVRSR